MLNNKTISLEMKVRMTKISVSVTYLAYLTMVKVKYIFNTDKMHLLLMNVNIYRFNLQNVKLSQLYRFATETVLHKKVQYVARQTLL